MRFYIEIIQNASVYLRFFLRLKKKFDFTLVKYNYNYYNLNRIKKYKDSCYLYEFCILKNHYFYNIS